MTYMLALMLCIELCTCTLLLNENLRAKSLTRYTDTCAGFIARAVTISASVCFTCDVPPRVLSWKCNRHNLPHLQMIHDQKQYADDQRGRQIIPIMQDVSGRHFA